MATDGNLLQGEITDFSKSRLQERDVVEGLLAGLLRALVEEQLVDSRFEAAPSAASSGSSSVSDSASDQQENSLPTEPTPKTISAVGAEAKPSRERNFVCLPGGREGTA
jgi:hypothetical protein